jgi:transcription elongation factor Elf1
MDNNNNQIHKFHCSRCDKFKLVLKKVADQQQHGFACEECWTAIEKRSRYNVCQIG